MKPAIDETMVEALRDALRAATALIMSIHELQKKTGLEIVTPPHSPTAAHCGACSCARQHEKGGRTHEAT